MAHQYLAKGLLKVCQILITCMVMKLYEQNNVQPNQSNQGNSNNKFLNFDGNDYAKIPYTFNETITTPGSYVSTTIDFEAGISIGSELGLYPFWIYGV